MIIFYNKLLERKFNHRNEGEKAFKLLISDMVKWVNVSFSLAVSLSSSSISIHISTSPTSDNEFNFMQIQLI